MGLSLLITAGLVMSGFAATWLGVELIFYPPQTPEARKRVRIALAVSFVALLGFSLWATVRGERAMADLPRQVAAYLRASTQKAEVPSNGPSPDATANSNSVPQRVTVESSKATQSMEPSQPTSNQQKQTSRTLKQKHPKNGTEVTVQPNPQGIITIEGGGAVIKDSWIDGGISTRGRNDVQNSQITNNHIGGTSVFENAGKAERMFIAGNIVQPPAGRQGQVLKNDSGGEMKDITVVSNQVMPAPVMNQQGTSGVLTEATESLHSLCKQWQEAEHSLQLQKYDEETSEMPPLEDHKKNANQVAFQITLLNQNNSRKLVRSVADADAFRRVLLAKIPKGEDIIADSTEEQAFQQLRDDANAVKEPGSCPATAMNAAADYLDALERRVPKN
jgi:hypothetical protein